MPINLHWADPSKTVICYTLIAPYTWTDFHEANEKCWQMIDNANMPVDLILNVSEVDRIPRNAHIHIPDALKNTHPNLNMIVFVGMNVYTRTIRNSMSRLFPHVLRNSRIAGNEDSAIELIQEARTVEAVI